MLKVLHTDKAQAALGYSINSSDREVEDTAVADEFRSLLSNARRKGAQVTASDSLDAISLAMAVQSLSTRPPSAVEQGEKTGNYQANEAANGAEHEELLGADDAAVSSNYSPLGEANQRPDTAGSSDSTSEQLLAGRQDQPELSARASSDGSAQAADTAVEDAVAVAPVAVEQWAKEVVGELDGVTAEKAPLGEAGEVVTEQTATSNLIPEQVANKQMRPVVEGAVGPEKVGLQESSNEQLVLVTEADQGAAVAQSSEEPASSLLAKDRDELASPIKVNIQPQVTKDPEIIPFIADSAAAMIRRSNEVSAQMMMLRQAFESLRAGSRREAVSGLGSAGGAGNSGSAALGGAFKGSQADSSPVREKPQQPLSRSATFRMLERVNATLKEAARARDGKTISLHLEPVDLGRIKVDVSLKEGALHARLTPESAQVGQALREHAHELQAALRRLGLDVEKVTVNVSADNQGNDFSADQQTLGDGKGFQGNRNNMPQDQRQVAENTFGNELAERGEQVGEHAEVALKEAKKARVLSWRDNWVA
jgi:flagellar hook-length control protein FliK